MYILYGSDSTSDKNTSLLTNQLTDASSVRQRVLSADHDKRTNLFVDD